MSLLVRKSMIGAIAAVSLAATFASTAPASAQYYRGGGWGWGAPVAAGVVGGAMLGAAIAGSNRPAYAGDCWIERRMVYDVDGNPIGRRRVRVCQ